MPTTTLAAPINPNSVGVRSRPSAMMAMNCTAICTPVPENVHSMPPRARLVSPWAAGEGGWSVPSDVIGGPWLQQSACHGPMHHLAPRRGVVSVAHQIVAQEVVEEVLLRGGQAVPPAVARVLDRCGRDIALE